MSPVRMSSERTDEDVKALFVSSGRCGLTVVAADERALVVGLNALRVFHVGGSFAP